MARRIDYHHDPDAPPANSIVPSVNVAVTNDAGEMLLIRRSDNDNWALPGGAVDLGESLAQAAIRETKEESGIDCEITGLSGSTPTPGTCCSTPATARSGRSSRSSSPRGPPAGSPRRAMRRPRSAGSRWATSAATGWMSRCGCASGTILEHRGQPYIG